MASLIVQKYGGTSVGTIDRIKRVARKIADIRDSGKDVMVVVSAMAGQTDQLMSMAREISHNPERREIDLLLSSGERISSALLTIALNAIGCQAVSMTGRQIGMLTDSSHTRARIKQIDAHRAKKVLEKKHVVVVAGFQGVNEQGDVTTLGRGGSDTSAVALAVALEAERCEICTDVDGVYTADPNMVPDARKLDVVFYEEMLEMASLGAKVLQIRCVEVAKKYNMPLIVRSSYNDEKGTLICEEDAKMERPQVSGIMYQKNQSKITVKGVQDHPGVAAGIFDALSQASVSVDMIIQNISAEGHADISFTLDTDLLHEAMEVMDKISDTFKPEQVISDSDIAKISIVGEGMRSHSGIAARMFNTLAKETVNLLMISTSEIRISCIIEEKYTELAVRALHEAFDLKLTPASASDTKPSQSKSAKKVKAV
jgi:aspartate kinase